MNWQWFPSLSFHLQFITISYYFVLCIITHCNTLSVKDTLLGRESTLLAQTWFQSSTKLEEIFLGWLKHLAEHDDTPRIRKSLQPQVLYSCRLKVEYVSISTMYSLKRQHCDTMSKIMLRQMTCTCVLEQGTSKPYWGHGYLSAGQGQHEFIIPHYSWLLPIITFVFTYCWLIPIINCIMMTSLLPVITYY